MKTRLLKVTLFTLLFTLTGCISEETKKQINDNSEKIEVLEQKIDALEKKVYTPNEIRIMSFCDSPDAVLKTDDHPSKYDTEKGKATLYIEIPSDHTLTLDNANTDKSKNKLYFNSRGSSYGNDTKIDTINISDLRKIEDETLYIEVLFYFDDDKYDCPRTIDIKGEKKKTSEIEGEPFDGH